MNCFTVTIWMVQGVSLILLVVGMAVDFSGDPRFPSFWGFPLFKFTGDISRATQAFAVLGCLANILAYVVSCISVAKGPSKKLGLLLSLILFGSAGCIILAVTIFGGYMADIGAAGNLEAGFWIMVVSGVI